MKTRIAMVVVALGSLAATSVHAQEASVATEAPAKKMRVGAQLELVPAGSLETNVLGRSQSTDTAFAYGIGGSLDYDLTPMISIGVAPRLVFNLKGDADGAEAAKELDLRARAMLHLPVAEKLTAYGFVAPGYSVIFLPADATADNPTGFALGFGAGAAYDVAPNLFVSAELGYQLGFQSVAAGDRTIDLKSNLFSLSFGGGARF
jgi:hypothetical protein